MIRKANYKDTDILARLAMKLFSDVTFERMKEEMELIVDSIDSDCYIAYDNEKPVGFMYCCLRYEYAEGVRTYPVGYLEGAFIEEEYRRKGYMKELFKFFETWAKTMGCKEVASDCELESLAGIEFHKSVGMEEVSRLIHFRKDI